MLKRAAVLACFASVLGVAAVYASAFLPGGAPRFMVPVMIVSIATMMIALMVLGAIRHNRLGSLAIPLALAWIIVVGGLLAAFVMPAESAAHPALLFGLPRRAAIVLYGVGLLPLFAMPIAYALTFDEVTLSQHDLDELRAQAADILERERAHQEAT